MNAGMNAPAAFPTPWAARAFAIVSAAAEAGWFSLKQFQQALIEAIGKRERAGECIGEEGSYYDCWIEALTSLLLDRGVATQQVESVEMVIRARWASLTHTHDEDDDHAHVPQPILTEGGR